MLSQKVETSVIVVTVTAVAVALGVMFWRKKRKGTNECSLEDMKIPSKWIKVGEVGELIMYPLKGAKRKCLDEAQFTRRGIMDLETSKLALQDRVFIVHDGKEGFMNVKKNSKMLFVETTALDMFSVKFSFPDADDLVVQIPENNSLDLVELYNGEKVKTVDCGDEAATWFSQRLLNQPSGLRLGCFVKSLVPPRTVKGSYDKQHTQVYTKFHSDYMGAYSDIASYMLMGEESLRDLNSRLNKPVTEHHFRPNLVVKGSPAFSEDSWDWVKIGDVVILRGFKYCTRCVVTSIDPDTAEKDPSTEPLRTLRKYRQVQEPEIKKLEGNSPVMGLYAGCHQSGIVRVGDPVYINAN